MHRIALQNEEPSSLKCQWCQGEESWVKRSNQRVEHQRTATEGQEYQLEGLGLAQGRNYLLVRSQC